MKNTILFSAVIFACSSGWAQLSQPNTLGVGGSFYSSSNLSVSYTVGEMTAVETFISPTLIITQGFQQPSVTVTGIENVSGQGLEASVFPNPVSDDKVFLSFQTPMSFKASIDVYDVAGRRVYVKEMANGSGSYLEEIKLSGLENGIYFLRAKYMFSNGRYSEFNSKINFTK